MKNLRFILFLFCYSSTFGQDIVSDIVIGQNHTIKSSVLNQDRTIQIYTPDGYSDSKQEYPVLYILDGQWYFTSGVAIKKALRNSRNIPDMIIVGINNSNPLRRTLFGEENEKFTKFLTDEIIHYIDSNYRTTQERIVFGWEDAAFYISKLILEKSKIFNGAIITNGGYASEDLVKNFTSEEDIYLFIANSKKDIYTVSEAEAFSEILKKNKPKNLIWKYDLFNDEVHISLPYLALYKGLKYYYHNHGIPSFESIQEYLDLGGMRYLHTYFKERAKRFGGSDQIEDNTKNGLIWLAWKRNNFKYFDVFMTEFKEVLSTQRYASAYWQHRFGQFYLKHKDYDNAVKYFNAGLTKYPNSDFEAAMQQGLLAAQNGKK